ncbi:MAG: tetratricopeptide repeat protein [Anaerolineae bacterium]|nr:tetratricopeptide repeat protein [Anaerolineae bacterium]
MTANQKVWPQVFCNIIISNCRYWLNRVNDNADVTLQEISQLLKGLTYSLSLPDAWDPTRNLILQLSPAMLRRGQLVTWQTYLLQAIAQSSIKNDPAEIDFRLQLGNLYRLQGRLSEAEQCLQEALRLCEHHQSQSRYWTLLNNLGLVARLAADHERAIEYCQQVLNQPNLPSEDQAEALNVMGLVAYDQRRWEDALNFFEQSLSHYRTLDDTYQQARIFNNRGLAQLRSGRLDEAQDSYQQAIRHFQLADDQAEIFKAIMNLGNAFLMKKAYEAAIQQYQTAVVGFEQNNYLIDLANVHNNLGMAYAGLTDWENAEANFSFSLDIARKQNDGYYLVNTLDNYAKMLIKAERLEQALDVLDQALSTLNTIPDNPATTFLRQFVEDRLIQVKNKLGTG